jgi:hypothetical protein
MVRDGRDSMVSYYFKILNSMPPAAPLRRKLDAVCPRPMGPDTIGENLPAFIRFMFEENRKSSISYDRHVRAAMDRGLFMIRYEGLKADPEENVARAVRHLSGRDADPERVRRALEQTSFEKRSGRRPGEEDRGHRTVRKGIVGDWRNHFSLEAARLFDSHAGDTLIALGYEPDGSWVDEVASASAPGAGAAPTAEARAHEGQGTA